MHIIVFDALGGVHASVRIPDGGTVEIRDCYSPGNGDIGGMDAAPVLVGGETWTAAVAEWKRSGERRGLDARYLAQAERFLIRFGSASGASPSDAGARDVELFLAEHCGGVSGTTQNRLLGYLSTFFSWCMRTERRRDNPARNVPRSRQLTDGGNRAFSAEEAAKVIAAAKADAESSSPRFRCRDRWVQYAVAWYAGLRRKELRMLEVREVRLADEPPRFTLLARTAKARTAQSIPMHRDLVEPLRELCRGKHPNDRVFSFLHDRVCPEDIVAAGVRREIDGKTTGMHSFRKGLATDMAKRNVAEATAMTVMRHTDPRLTRKIYTDARLLPVAAAMAETAGVLHTAEAFIHTDGKSLDPAAGSDDSARVTRPMKSTPAHSDPQNPAPLALDAGTCDNSRFAEGRGSLGRDVQRRNLSADPHETRDECRRQESNLTPDDVADLLEASSRLTAVAARILRRAPEGAARVAPGRNA